MHVGDLLDNNVDEHQILDYYARRHKYSVVKNIMEYRMSEDLSIQFEETTSYDIIEMLKSIFNHHFRVARFELEK